VGVLGKQNATGLTGSTPSILRKSMPPTDRQKRKRNAEYQARWRERRNAAARNDPDAIEHALLQEMEREISEKGRIVLANKLADTAMDFQRRAIRLSKMATKVRMGRGRVNNETGS